MRRKGLGESDKKREIKEVNQKRDDDDKKIQGDQKKSG
jgi:hypothetical protein